MQPSLYGQPLSYWCLTKGYGSSWISEPRLTCANALRRVQHPAFSLVRDPCIHCRRARHRPQPSRDQPHPRLGPHRRPGQPPHHPGYTRPATRRSGHDRPLDLLDKRSWRHRARRRRVHPVLRRAPSTSPGQPGPAHTGLAMAGGHRRHHRGRPTDRAGRQPSRHPSRLLLGAGWAVLGRLGRLQHRPRPRPAGRPIGVRHGPHRPGAHHPPTHATGRLATGDTRPNRTGGRTPGRPRSRTAAQVGRPPRIRAATAGSGSTD
jgi:hypothetical protein